MNMILVNISIRLKNKKLVRLYRARFKFRHGHLKKKLEKDNSFQTTIGRSKVLKDYLVRQLSRLRFNSSHKSASVFCVFNFSDLPLQTKEARALHVRILNNFCEILLC